MSEPLTMSNEHEIQMLSDRLRFYVSYNLLFFCLSRLGLWSVAIFITLPAYFLLEFFTSHCLPCLHNTFSWLLWRLRGQSKTALPCHSFQHHHSMHNHQVRTKSLHKSFAGSHFYGTGYEIWAGLAVLKIMNWAVKYATFAGNFGQNIFLKYC